MAVTLQVFGRINDEDEITIVLGALPKHMIGACDHHGGRRWTITIDKHEAERAPYMAGLVLVHEWGHYRASHDPEHFNHRGAWPAEAAAAYRLAFTPKKA